MDLKSKSDHPIPKPVKVESKEGMGGSQSRK